MKIWFEKNKWYDGENIVKWCVCGKIKMADMES